MVMSVTIFPLVTLVQSDASGIRMEEIQQTVDWESATRMIANVSKFDKFVVEKSTIPVKTIEEIEKILTHNTNGINFQIISNPKFLAEGTTIQGLLNPDRSLLEAGDSKRAECSGRFEGSL